MDTDDDGDNGRFKRQETKTRMYTKTQSIKQTRSTGECDVNAVVCVRGNLMKKMLGGLWALDGVVNGSSHEVVNQGRDGHRGGRTGVVKESSGINQNKDGSERVGREEFINKAETRGTS